MKKRMAALVVAALCVSMSACGGSTSSGTKTVSSAAVSKAETSAEDGSGTTSGADASAADSSGKDASGEDVSGADASGADASGADASGADASGADASGKDASGADGSGKDGSGADASGKDASGADGSGADASGKDTSGTDSSEGKGKDASSEDEKPSKVMEGISPEDVVAWEYEDEYVPFLSGLEEGKVYEADYAGDVTFLNDTYEDYIVYYESDEGRSGAMAFAAETMEGLIDADPVAYFADGDVIRIRIEKVDPKTLDRDTMSVAFVDTLEKGEEVPLTGIYMLVNGGDEDVTVAYKDISGEDTTFTIKPGTCIGFEWMCLEKPMKVV